MEGALGELGDDIERWRQVLQQVVRRGPAGLEDLSPAELRRGLTTRMAALNARVEDVVNRPRQEAPLGEGERRGFYRLLAGLRSVSQAFIAYAEAASRIDWAVWREERS